MPSFPDIENKRVIVTGGGSGIGFANAKEFGSEGARIFLLDVSEDNLQEALSELSADGIEVVTHVASVTESSELEEAFLECDRRFGGVDVLINNAGISGHIPTLDILDHQWQKILDINLTGLFKCAREAGKRMCSQETYQPFT